MKDIPPEAAGQIAASVPLFALAVALFLTAFMLIAGVLLSLIPNVYKHKSDDPNQKRKMLGVMILIALVSAGFGWLALNSLTNHLVGAAEIMSKVQETKE